MLTGEGIDTNLQGQRLGRKGRVTRERIITAARALLDTPRGDPLSLSAVAREAGLGLSSLYVYFGDLTELLLAVLEPVEAQAKTAYGEMAREWWPEEELGEEVLRFVTAFYEFWQRHSRLLHLRNTLSDQHDMRMLTQRIDMARPLIRLLGQQMGAPVDQQAASTYDFASVLFTGLERVVTTATDERLRDLMPANVKRRFAHKTLAQEARLLTLAIADERARLHVS